MATTPRQSIAGVESLELRRLLSGAVYIVTGTPGDDSIQVQVEKGVITAVINGNAQFASDAQFDAIDIRGLDGNDHIQVLNSGDNDIFISGDNPDGSGTGNDQIDLGTGNLDAMAAPTVITAGGGNDHVRLNDQNALFGDTFTFTETTAGRFFFGGVTFPADLEQLTLFASRGSSQLNVNATSAATRLSIHSGTGTDTINVHSTHPQSPVWILAAPTDDAVNVNLDGAGTAGVVFPESRRMGALSIGGGGSAAILPGGGSILTVTGITLSGDATLDLANNTVVIDYGGSSPITPVAAALASGYASGAWNGSGIVSSTAATQNHTGVGLAEADDLFTSFPASFQGQQVDSTSLLMTYTLYGDADLNRQVNLADFNRLAANFGHSDRRWSHGDFDYTGAVNLGDFNRLAANFGAMLQLPDVDGDEEPPLG